ncbi:DUF368 domain-containing protein [Candidatus Margulisiibacteriota bacterium]
MINKLVQVSKNIAYGACLGIANIIPGVSGGTMAVILGIYSKLIHAIGNFFSDRKNRKQYFGFLTQIAIGAGISIIVFSRLISFLLKNAPHPTFFFFMGLIMGSIPIIFKSCPNLKLSISNSISFIVAFGLIILLSSFNHSLDTSFHFTAVTAKEILTLFVSGFLAAGAMVIPGISGSFILLLLGCYGTIIQAVSEFNLPIIFYVAAGAVPGLLFITKIIDISIRKYPTQITSAILGLIIASFYPLWPGFTFDLSSLMSVFVFVIGVFLATILSKKPGT